ncbi:hypothetical protein QZH41_000596 [Actinostola sp. cb2023]|nr:hypothetical protein QZH41_000596 [Actinostola sp. cb2023]
MMDALGQHHSVITFDLAIYMKAKEIQWRRPVEFRNTIIRMGGFHIALNFLAVIGKMFQDSGIEDLLIESGIYGSNSASALLKGKSYNRGVRAHKLLMEALLRLEWEAFGEWMTQERNVEAGELREDQCISLITACQKSVHDAASLKSSFAQLCNELDQVQDRFSKFRQQACEQSKLFYFWNMYIDVVMLLLRFIRAEREGSWELHLNAVAEMTPYFFSMDRINYSRWLPVYLADMQMLPKWAPEVYNEFVNGNHPVERSNKPFSQVWTDMALEQSINRDSKAGGGIIGLTQNASALERWFLTSHERAAITSATKQLCNLGDDEYVGTHKEAGLQRVKRDELDVQKLLKTIATTMSNPFDLSEASRVDPAPLRNIATGVLMPNDVTERLIGCFRTGTEELKKFTSKRMNTAEVSFWDKISKLNVKTFASLSKVSHIKSVDEKIITISADRNLFGRLLIAAKCRDVDLKEVLSYELSTVPFSLAHADGSLRKTTKSILMTELERMSQAEGRLPVREVSTAFIFDGMAMIQMLKSGGSRTFGELAERHYRVISTPLRQGQCTRVDVVFDRYDLLQSIKESERVKRGSSNALEIKISNRNTPVPRQWSKYISNKRNKINLSNFLCQEWCEIGQGELLPGQQLIVAGGFEDPTDAVMISSQHLDHVPELRSDHEEADTRMILHAKHASSSKQRIVIQSPDTDVAVLATYSFQTIQCEELWFKTGVKDKVRFIPIHLVSEKLGVTICAALPGFHALTGCDSTSGLFRTGKKKAWKAFLKDPSAQDNVGNLGTAIPPSARTLQACEKFVCSLYTTAKKAGVTSDECSETHFMRRLF